MTQFFIVMIVLTVDRYAAMIRGYIMENFKVIKTEAEEVSDADLEEVKHEPEYHRGMARGFGAQLKQMLQENQEIMEVTLV